MNVQSKTYERPHMTNKYNDLSYLIGEPLAIICGLDLETMPDGKVEIIGDYPNTVLLQMEFRKSIWSDNVPPRKVRVMIPKASMACGDVKLKRIHTGEFLIGDQICDTLTTEEAILKE